MRLQLVPMFIVLVVGCVHAQDPNFTKGAPNGLAWRGLSFEEKAMMLVGFKQGVFAALHPSYTGNLPSCPTIVDAAKWDGAGTIDDLLRAINKFYESATNIALPITVAVVYSLMKGNRASNRELDQYRTQALKAFVN
jgi:hypothetical protein